MPRPPIVDGVQRHLIHGGVARHEHLVPMEDMVGQYDAPADANYGDPMSGTEGVGSGMFEGNTAGAIMAANAAQAAGLDSAAGPNGDPIDMGMASDCNDEVSKGGIPYGPKNTGGRY